jgi:hypothetical protein
MATPSVIQNLRRAQAQYVRNQRERQQQLTKLRSDIKKTMILVIVGALAVATIADILSIFDVGWVVSWAIPCICAVMVRRVTRINKAGEQLATATAAAQRQLQVLRQRLRPALMATGNVRLAIGGIGGAIAWRARSYVTTFIRDTVITQLIELVPIIDILPVYIGQVVKMIIDQNVAYQKAKKLLPNLERALQQIDQLERFEIEYLARALAVTARVRQHVNQRQRREAPAPSAPLRPAFASP